MEDPVQSAVGRDRRLILAVIVALGLLLGGLACRYFDDLTDLARSLTSGQTGRAQGRFHY